LYINRTKQIIELEKGDLKTLAEYCSRQIKMALPQLNTGQSQKSLDVFLSQELVWSRILVHFRIKSPNFSLQIIEFCVEKLFGLAKYPINVWNQLELSNNDLKYNFSMQKQKLNFFLKSAV